MDDGVFRPKQRQYQYLTQEQREKLLRDYTSAWQKYREATVRARESYAKLIKLGLLPADDTKTEE